MSMRSVALLIVAAVLALGVATFVRRSLGEEEKAALTRVLVARDDITKGSFVQPDKQFEWKEWAEPLEPKLLVEGKIDPQKFSGAVARHPIPAGQPIDEASLVKSSEGGFMAAVLEPGRRAISIAVDATTGNAGFIFPGDRVDLIVTHRFQTSQNDGPEQAAQERLASETFVEGVRVLAVDQMVANADNTAMIAKTVTLEVTKQQAEKINVAKDLGKISLALRSLTHEPENGDALIGAAGPGYARDSDVSQMLNPESNAAAKVQLFRGSEHQQLQFEQH